MGRVLNSSDTIYVVDKSGKRHEASGNTTHADLMDSVEKGSSWENYQEAGVNNEPLFEGFEAEEYTGKSPLRYVPLVILASIILLLVSAKASDNSFPEIEKIISNPADKNIISLQSLLVNKKILNIVTKI